MNEIMNDNVNENIGGNGSAKVKKTRTIVTVIVAVAIFLFAFGGGFLTARLTRKRAVSSYEWAIKMVQKYYYEDVPSDMFLNYSLKGMAAGCLDKYSAYYTAEEYEQMTATHSGSMSGIGVSYMYVKEDENYNHPQHMSGTLIESVVGNSPAYASGLRAGEFVSGARDGNGEVQFKGKDDFGTYIDSKATGEVFTLITDRGEHEMSKQNYTASYCTMSTSSATYDVVYRNGAPIIEKTESESGGGISYLPDGAAYLRLNQFYGNAASEMAALIEKFNAEKCDSLILDLRGNGGGYVDVMCDISGIFTGQLQKPYKIGMQAVYKNGKREAYNVTNLFPKSSQLPRDTRVSVLADCGTASASEALIGVLIDNGVADYGDIYVSDFTEDYFALTGLENKNCRTYGKGIMQTTFVHPFTGEALKLTTAKIYWPKGETSIHGVGLNVSQGCKTVKAGWDVTYDDEQLALAVSAIYGQ